jgi:lantibiotic transport system ATP-binding protein
MYASTSVTSSGWFITFSSQRLCCAIVLLKIIEMNVTPVIHTTGLSYAYSKGNHTIRSIDLLVEKGSIYGFLGSNGSGKTTTLSLLLGLLPLQQGTIQLFGENLTANRAGILQRIGSLIENPSLYAHLTAGENMEIFRRIYGATRERVNEVLNMVGLEEVGNKLVKRFSLGMKQRLAIAIALLPNPALLILDEPTNGLDPNGIIDLRMLLKRLNKGYGMTILVSSHLLAEVEKIATHIGVIAKGSLVFQGTINELQLLQQKHTVVQLKTSDDERAYGLLQEFGPERTWNKLLIPYHSKEDLAAISRILASHQLDVYLLQPRKNNLEELFIELTNTAS